MKYRNSNQFDCMNYGPTIPENNICIDPVQETHNNYAIHTTYVSSLITTCNMIEDSLDCHICIQAAHVIHPSKNPKSFFCVFLIRRDSQGTSQEQVSNYTWKLDTSLDQFHITCAGLDDPEALLCIAQQRLQKPWKSSCFLVYRISCLNLWFSSSLDSTHKSQILEQDL